MLMESQMKNRMMSIWPNVNKNKIYNSIASHLELDFLAYTFDKEFEINNVNFPFESDAINTNQRIEYYLSECQRYKPLEFSLLNKIKHFEKDGFDIIYRWRSSLIGSNDYRKISLLFYDLLRYWSGYIDDKKINLIFISYIPHSIHNFIIYSIAKISDIPLIMGRTLPPITSSNSVYYFSTSIEKLYKSFEEDYNNLKNKYANSKITLSDFNAHFREYLSEVDVQKTLVASIENNKIELIFSRLKLYLKQKRIGILFGKFVKLIYLRISDDAILRYLKKIEQKPNFKKKFIYFPLHWQPEATTLPNGGVFREQLLAIDLISRNLPKNYDLYVREHPAYWLNPVKFDYMKDSRSKKFYNHIVALSNVYLIDHNFNNSILLDKADAVATINGSIAFEAMRIGKPAMVFGNSFYNFYDNITVIKNSNDIVDFFKKNIKKSKSKDELLKDFYVFMKAIEKISVESIRESSIEAVILNEQNIAEGLVDFINKSIELKTNQI